MLCFTSFCGSLRNFILFIKTVCFSKVVRFDCKHGYSSGWGTGCWCSCRRSRSLPASASPQPLRGQGHPIPPSWCTALWGTRAGFGQVSCTEGGREKSFELLGVSCDLDSQPPAPGTSFLARVPGRGMQVLLVGTIGYVDCRCGSQIAMSLNISICYLTASAGSSARGPSGLK